MKRTLKIVGWTAGSLLAVCILALVGALLFLPAGTLRDLAVQRASASLGREVTVDDAGVSLRGGLGVRLDGVTVGNPPGFPGEPLFRAGSVDLKLRLIPLLSRRIQADRLVIADPRVNLIVRGDSTSNFTFAPVDAEEPGPSPSAPPADSPAALDVERFTVSGGRVVFRDEAAGTTTTCTGLSLAWRVVPDGSDGLLTSGETGIDSLSVSGPEPLVLTGLSLDHEARIDLQEKSGSLLRGDLGLGELDAAVTGDFSFPSGAMAGDFALKAPRLDAADLMALLPDRARAPLAGAEVSGAVALDLAFAFDQTRPEPLSWTGQVEVQDGRIALPDPSEPVTAIGGRASFDRRVLTIASIEASASGADLTFQGTITGYTDPQAAVLEGSLAATADLAALQGRLPAERKATLAGRGVGSIRLQGPLSRPAELPAEGRLAITDLSYRDATIFEPLTDLDADLEFDRKDLTIRSCRAVFEPSNFTLTGSVRGLVTALTAKLTGQPAPATVPHLEFSLDAPVLDADHLFPAASPGAPEPASATGGDRTAVLSSFPDITGRGAVTVGRLVYGGVDFTQVSGSVAIADRTVTVSDVQGSVYAGSITGETAVDLEDMLVPGYRGSFAATGIQADSLLSRFTPLQGHVFGDLDFGGDFTARGKDPDTFRRSLTLDAVSVLTQGRLMTSGTVQQGLNVLAVKLGRTFDREEKLKDLAGAVKVADQQVLLEEMSFTIPGLGALTLGGGYGFAGDLDFIGDLLLTEENTRKLLGGGDSGGIGGALGGLLGGSRDQPPQPLRLPLKIRGTWTKPDVAVDFAAMGRTAGQDVADELKKKLEGFLSGNPR
ncbi:AsmA family protein [bacterium]|nr:AsmA family protein [bacterium]